MTDPNDELKFWSIFGIGVPRKAESAWERPLIVRTNETFTRSNGTIMARVYERLTKRSRRVQPFKDGWIERQEKAYRRGVYDAFAALREELK